MRSYKRKDVCVLVLDRGEKLIESVLKFVEDNGINAAYVTGIGALEKPTLGYFNVDTKEYQKKEFSGSFELVSLKGNISEKENKVIFHPHVSLGGRDYGLLGGHLFDGIVSVTAEIFIFPVEGKLMRKTDSDIHLDLIKEIKD